MEMSNVLGVNGAEDSGKYWSLPIMRGRSRKRLGLCERLGCK